MEISSYAQIFLEKVAQILVLMQKRMTLYFHIISEVGGNEGKMINPPEWRKERADQDILTVYFKIRTKYCQNSICSLNPRTFHHQPCRKSLYYITEMKLGLICIIVTLVEINYYHHFYLSRSEALPEINCHFNEMRF